MLRETVENKLRQKKQVEDNINEIVQNVNQVCGMSNAGVYIYICYAQCFYFVVMWLCLCILSLLLHLESLITIFFLLLGCGCVETI